MKWMPRTLMSLLAVACLLAGPQLMAQEGSAGGSGEATEPAPSPVRDRLLKSLKAYETVMVGMAQAQAQGASEMTYELMVNASKGEQQAKLAVNIGIKQNPAKQQVRLSLGGDLGNVEAVLNAGTATVLLPDFSIYSSMPFDPAKLAQQMGGMPGGAPGLPGEVPDVPTDPKTQVKMALEMITEKIMEADLSKASMAAPQEFDGEACDVIRLKDGDGMLDVYISKATDLLRGLKGAGMDNGDASGEVVVKYNEAKLPVLVKGQITAKGADAGNASLEIKMGWENSVPVKVDLRIAGAMEDGLKVQIDARVRSKTNVNLPADTFVLPLDPETHQQVPIEQIGTSMMMGAMGVMMKFQMLMQPQQPEGSAPGGNGF